MLNMPTHNEKLFASIENFNPEAVKIRKSDLAFLRGIDLQHPYFEDILKSAAPVEAEVYRDNISEDGVIYIRIALMIRVAEEKTLLEPEAAILWIGSDEFVSLDGVSQIAEYEFDFAEAEELMTRLGLEW